MKRKPITRVRKSGTGSTAAVGAKKRQRSARVQLAARAVALPPVITRRSVGDRARAILEKHKIDLSPANLAVCSDFVMAGDAADHLFAELLKSDGENAARIGSAMATLLKQRRACLKDMGLPGDPDELDILVGNRTPAPATPRDAKPKSALDALMEE